MRIVLDTSALITALRSSAGAAAEVLRLVFLRQLIVLMDYKLACEYREIALRPEHLSISGKTPAEMQVILDALEAVAEPVLVIAQPRPLSSDPSDDMVLDIAINGEPDAIVTNNLKHFREPARRFSIPVMTPVDLLRRLK